MASEKRGGKDIDMPLIELRQLIGQDKQTIKGGIIAQVNKMHDDPNATDYLKPGNDT